MDFLPHTSRLSLGILLGTLALSAFFLARGATRLVAGAFLPAVATTVPEASPRFAATRPPGAEPPDLHAILQRNIFDPTTGALWPPKAAELVPGEGEAIEAPQELAPGEIPPACEGSLRLIASVYFENSPEWSFATVSTGAESPLLYREGGSVDGKQVFSVLPKAVFLRLGNGRLCSLLLFPGPNAQPVAQTGLPPTTPTPAITATPFAGGSISEDEMNQGIKAQGETQYTVQRSFVDKILQNQAEIMRSARIVPHEENGQVTGVKLYGIRRNSLLGKLGLQNGDLLRTINGFAMSSPDTALEAYSRLRSADKLSVAVTRRGRPMSVDYNIQ